jgi:hypothetical protein
LERQSVEKSQPFTGLQSPLRFKPLILSVYRVPQMQGVGHAEALLYFKCPTTKQMRCPVNAYEKSSPAASDMTSSFHLDQTARSIKLSPQKADKEN